LINRVRLISTAAVVSAATSDVTDQPAEASEWGCEVLLCESSSKPGLARRACLPPSDVQADLRYGKMGLSVAHLPRGWDRQTRHVSRRLERLDRGGVHVTAACRSASGLRDRDGCEQTVTVSRPLSWDTALKGDRSSDYSVGTTWAMDGGNYHLLDLIRARAPEHHARSSSTLATASSVTMWLT
jgi:hypothetical protein